MTRPVKLNRSQIRSLLSEAIQTREAGSPLWDPQWQPESNVSEEYLRGVQEFEFREATTKYVDDIRKKIFRFIQANKSNTEVDTRQAQAAANEVLKDLEEKANDLLEDQLYQFIRRV